MSSPSAADIGTVTDYDDDYDDAPRRHSGGGGAADSGSAADEQLTTITLRLNTDMAAAQRFPVWMSLAVFSAVCVTALQSRRGILAVDGPGEAWILSVFCISFVVSLAVVFLYLLYRAPFVGQIPEVVVTSLLIAFWAAGLPTVMNPRNDIAVSSPNGVYVAAVVTNANLYFFSWLSFGATIYLSSSLAHELSGMPLQSLASKAARWYGLTVSSLVVLGAAVRTYQAKDCGNDRGGSADVVTFCRRTKFAVGLGVVGFVSAGLMTYLVQRQAPPLTVAAETIFTTTLLILWGFGVSYITFGQSPGSTIGNLYFGTWISFLLTVVLFAVCFRECVAGRVVDHAARPQNGDRDHTNETHPGNHGATPPLPEFDDAI